MSPGAAPSGSSDLVRTGLLRRFGWARQRRNRWEVVTEEGEPRYKPIDLKLVRRLLELLSPMFMQRLIDYSKRFVDHSLGSAVTLSMAGRHVLGIVALWALAM